LRCTVKEIAPFPPSKTGREKGENVKENERKIKGKGKVEFKG
jgi:hypothetical protein